MIFSLKERQQQVNQELEESWINEVYQFVKLIVLGIDASLVVKKREDFVNVISVVMPSKGSGESKVLVGMTFYDEGKNSILINISENGNYVIPLDQQHFAVKLKEIIEREKAK